MEVPVLPPVHMRPIVHLHVSWWTHWLHVLFGPRSATWRAYSKDVSEGETGFSVPGRPDANKCGWWPSEWILTRSITKDEEIRRLEELTPDYDRTQKLIGWQAITADCVETGVKMKAGEGYLCPRCQDPVVHHRVFRQPQTPPFCSACRLVMKLTFDKLALL